MSKTIHDVAGDLLAALDAYKLDLSIAKRYIVDLWVDRTSYTDGQHYRLSFSANGPHDAAQLCCCSLPESVFWMVTEAREEEVAS